MILIRNRTRLTIFHVEIHRLSGIIIIVRLFFYFKIFVQIFIPDIGNTSIVLFVEIPIAIKKKTSKHCVSRYAKVIRDEVIVCNNTSDY